MAVPGVPLALVAGGGVLIYSGVENRPVADIFRSLAAGRPPQPGPFPAGPLIVSPDSPSGGTATGQQIAADALAYQGHCYTYGGAPGTDGTGCWDCSSFCNWVIGHDLGLAIPGFAGGTYTGATHGPPTGAWLLWTGVTRIRVADAGAGDVFCWQTHMGIATGPDSMISAEDPQNGTRVATGNIATFMPGEVLFVLRLKAALPPAGSGGRKK
jgi:cell wall-associated NlpC family hydrolase